METLFSSQLRRALIQIKFNKIHYVLLTAPYPTRSNWPYYNKVVCPSSEVNTTWVEDGACGNQESYYDPYFDQQIEQSKKINWNNVTSIDIGFQFEYTDAYDEKLTVLLTSPSSWDFNNNCNMTLDFNIQAKLGYRYDDNKIHWHLLATSETNQSLDCYFTGASNQCSFECKPFAMFELQNLNYHFYLLNIRIKASNEGVSDLVNSVLHHPTV